METIYDIAYKYFYELVIKLTDEYPDEEMIDEVLKFFDEGKHQEVFAIYNSYGYKTDDIKEIIKLIIASKSYITNLYRAEKGLDQEDCAGMLSILEDLNDKNILEFFLEKNEICRSLISDAIEYINSPFIFQNLSKELVIKKKKTKYLLKLNQYEIFDLHNYISSDEFTKSEMTIQFLFDTYDSACDYVFDDEYGEEDDYESQDAFIDKVFIEKLEEKLKDDELILVYQYLLANVYELMVTIPMQDKSFLEACHDMQEYLEKTPLDYLIKELKTNPLFAKNVINSFINNNQYLVDSELIIRRNSFKENGNIDFLAQFNPFYEEEERVFTRLVREYQEKHK